MKKLTEIIAGIILSSATCIPISCSKSESQQIVEEATKYYATGCESKDYSTPQKAFEEYMHIIKNKDYLEILKSLDFSEEEANQIIKETDKETINKLSSDIDKRDLSFDAVDTKYYIDNKEKEEIALVKVIVTNKTTSEKELCYYRFVNNLGKWRYIDKVPSPIPGYIDTYNESTIKDKTHKSRLLEKIRKEIIELQKKESSLDKLRSEKGVNEEYVSEVIKQRAYEEVSRRQIERNEEAIKVIMRTLSTQAELYHIKNGKYPPLEKIIDTKYVESMGYKLEQIKLEDHNFAVKAIPIAQGKTGRNSYWIDFTGVIRKADNPNVNEKSDYDPTAPKMPGMR